MAEALADHINQPQFVLLLQRILYDKINPDSETLSADILLDECPRFVGTISVYHSAIACFYAPSNLCGAGGMYQERICSNPDWHGEYACYDIHTFCLFMVLLFYRKISTSWIPLIYSMHTLLTPILTTIAMGFHNNKRILLYLFILSFRTCILVGPVRLVDTC